MLMGHLAHWYHLTSRARETFLRSLRIYRPSFSSSHQHRKVSVPCLQRGCANSCFTIWLHQMKIRLRKHSNLKIFFANTNRCLTIISPPISYCRMALTANIFDVQQNYWRLWALYMIGYQIILHISINTHHFCMLTARVVSPKILTFRGTRLFLTRWRGSEVWWLLFNSGVYGGDHVTIVPLEIMAQPTKILKECVAKRTIC